MGTMSIPDERPTLWDLAVSRARYAVAKAHDIPEDQTDPAEVDNAARQLVDIMLGVERP